VKKSKIVIINEKEYPSLSVAARELGVSRSTLASRLKASKDGNINVCAKNNIEIEGVFFKSLREAANFFGVKYQTFVSRYHSGAKGKDLTGTRSRQFDGKTVEYEGLSFLKTKYMLEHFGLCQATYNGWLRYGLTQNEAINLMRGKTHSEESSTTKCNKAA
tara:strand:- start:6145 stop:6627 length:483 start_codon:yes stop_codon:yes gene_type:complete